MSDNKKTQKEKDFSFRKYAWKQFKKNKPSIISFYILILLVVVALSAHFIANDQPLFAKYRGKTFYPAFQTYFNSAKVDSTINPNTGNWEKLQFDITDWKQLELESVVWAPIPYSPEKPDRYNREYVSPSAVQYYKNPEGKRVVAPGKFRHHLGTDAIGRDVASGLIHGTKVSLLVGIISMGIASIIGITLGALAGFFGDKNLVATRFRYYMTILGVILGFFYGFIARSLSITEGFNNGIGSGLLQLAISLILLVGVTLLLNMFGKLKLPGFLGKDTNVPVDSIVSRSIEILNSMPRLLLIITISAIMKERSLTILMVIIGITSWTGIARFTRAEFLKIRELEYLQAAKALGYSNRRTMVKHALPNGLAPVFVSIAFGIASAILIESGLSFLGIGVPDEAVTWGSLLSLGRQEFEAWWLVMFPGAAIFITITVYNLIGEGLRDALDPKLKQ
ncbi:MAG: ABC transporter permease [Flavobacteriales bacterium]|nr:ABC transporter permease [Flavobacteriales bacterium]